MITAFSVAAALSAFSMTVFALRWYERPSYPVALHCLIALTGLTVALSLIDKPRRVDWRYACIVLMAIMFAFMRIAAATHTTNSLDIDKHAMGQTAVIRGVVSAEPDRRPMQTKYVISVQEVTFVASGTVLFPVRGNVLVTDHGKWPEFEYGDTVTAYGTLEKPGTIDDFRYDKYLSRFDIYAVMYSASLKLIDSSDAFGFFRRMYRVKNTFESQINRLYGEPNASFMAGLLTGSRRGIPEELMNDFNVTGLTHIIAISGYNITIVISIISGMLFFLPKKMRLFPAIIAIVVFTLFVGASAAVVRAAIMGILGLIALHASRTNNARITVLWTLTFMIAYNPKYLWYDAGFQLSFLAVAGLMETTVLLEKFTRKIPETLGLRESIQMTLSAQLFAVPLIVILFRRMSLIAPIANVLVGPFIPAAMFFGFAGTMVSFVSFPLGQLIAFFGDGVLRWIVLVAEALAQLPLASVNTPDANIAWAVTYYAFLITIIVFANRKKATRRASNDDLFVRT